MFNIPNKVRVGAYDYSVEYNRNIYVDGVSCYGDCNFTLKRIRIDPDCPKVIQEAFIHELVHAIVYEYGITDVKNVDEETVARVLSRGLIQVLRDADMDIKKREQKVEVNLKMAGGTNDGK